MVFFFEPAYSRAIGEHGHSPSPAIFDTTGQISKATAIDSHAGKLTSNSIPLTSVQTMTSHQAKGLQAVYRLFTGFR